MVGDVFGKLNEAEDNFVLAKYIFDRIKEFNQKENKTKDDVLELYISLVEHYEMLENPIAQEEENRFELCVALHERIQSIMEKIVQHESKLSKKCKRGCPKSQEMT